MPGAACLPERGARDGCPDCDQQDSSLALHHRIAGLGCFFGEEPAIPGSLVTNISDERQTVFYKC